MFSHMMVGTNDMARSKAFYDALFAAMGGKPGREDPLGRVVYLHRGAMFLISKPIDGQAATAGNGSTLGFNVALTAQRPRELGIARVVQKEGLRVGPGSRGDGIHAVGALGKVYDMAGPDRLALALRILRDAYGEPNPLPKVHWDQPQVYGFWLPPLPVYATGDPVTRVLVRRDG